ncbi:FixH family protein [Thiocystis violascens]|uniref:Putative integral membrane protein linked to a cation pump n=1 Tax=Thiocystis violascens (strain ATCC 17096 / DSM 198 / 6111) TaxID=765911 RepID=I3Y7V5_THIV6|nr:FixH family protein [Thiocystis violascens]AFL73073.1 putative integral membrane protein linked to a cation pump [Thiocystis violascens DSM 198]
MTTQAKLTNTPALRNPWIIGWLGLVATVLIVNLIMVYFAVSTNPGLVNADYYDRGQDYEQTLVSRQARDPNWTMRADIPKPLRVGEPDMVRVVLVDKAGQPVDADAVTFHAYRPSDAARDFSLPMTREDRGRYAVKAAFPLIGAWDTLIAVQSGADEYSIGERVTVDGH